MADTAYLCAPLDEGHALLLQSDLLVRQSSLHKLTDCVYSNGLPHEPHAQLQTCDEAIKMTI